MDIVENMHLLAKACRGYRQIIKEAQEKELMKAQEGALIVKDVIDVPTQFAARFNLQMGQFRKYQGADKYAVIPRTDMDDILSPDEYFEVIFEYNTFPLSYDSEKRRKKRIHTKAPETWLLIKFHSHIHYPHFFVMEFPYKYENEHQTDVDIARVLQQMREERLEPTYENFLHVLQSAAEGFSLYSSLVEMKGMKSDREFTKRLDQLVDIDIDKLARREDVALKEAITELMLEEQQRREGSMEPGEEIPRPSLFEIMSFLRDKYGTASIGDKNANTSLFNLIKKREELGDSEFKMMVEGFVEGQHLANQYKMVYPTSVYYDVDGLYSRYMEKENGNRLLAGAVKKRMRPDYAEEQETLRRESIPTEHEPPHRLMGQIDMESFLRMKDLFPAAADYPVRIDYDEYFDSQEDISEYRKLEDLSPANIRVWRQKLLISKIKAKTQEPEKLVKLCELQQIIDPESPFFWAHKIDTYVQMSAKMSELNAKVNNNLYEGVDWLFTDYPGGERIHHRMNELHGSFQEPGQHPSVPAENYPGGAYIINVQQFSSIMDVLRLAQKKIQGFTRAIAKLDKNRSVSLDDYKSTTKNLQDVMLAFLRTCSYFDRGPQKEWRLSFDSAFGLLNGVLDDVMRSKSRIPPSTRDAMWNEFHRKMENIRSARMDYAESANMDSKSRRKSRLSAETWKDIFIRTSEEGEIEGYVLSPEVAGDVGAIITEIDEQSAYVVQMVLQNKDDPFWGVYDEFIDQYKTMYDLLSRDGFKFNMTREDPMVRGVSSGKPFGPIYVQRMDGTSGTVKTSEETIRAFPPRDVAFPEFTPGENGIPAAPVSLLDLRAISEMITGGAPETVSDLRKAAENAAVFEPVTDPGFVLELTHDLAKEKEKETRDVGETSVDGDISPISFEDASGLTRQQYRALEKSGRPQSRGKTNIFMEYATDDEKNKFRELKATLKDLFKNTTKITGMSGEMLSESHLATLKSMPADKASEKQIAYLEKFLARKTELDSQIDTLVKKVLERAAVSDTIDNVADTIRAKLPGKIAEAIFLRIINSNAYVRDIISSNAVLENFMKEKIRHFITDYVKSYPSVMVSSMQQITAATSEATDRIGWSASLVPYYRAFRNYYPRFADQKLSKMETREVKAKDKQRRIMMFLFNMDEGQRDVPLFYTNEFVDTMIANTASEVYELDKMIMDRTLDMFYGEMSADDETGKQIRSGRYNGELSLEHQAFETGMISMEDVITNAIVAELDMPGSKIRNFAKNMNNVMAEFIMNGDKNIGDFIFARVEKFLSGSSPRKQHKELFDSTPEVIGYMYSVLAKPMERIDIKKSKLISEQEGELKGRIQSMVRESRRGVVIPSTLEKMAVLVSGEIYNLDSRLFGIFQEEISKPRKTVDIQSLLSMVKNKVLMAAQGELTDLERMVMLHARGISRLDETLPSVVSTDDFMQMVSTYVDKRLEEMLSIGKKNDFDNIHRFTPYVGRQRSVVVEAIISLLPVEDFTASGYSRQEIYGIISDIVEAKLFRKVKNRTKILYDVIGRPFQQQFGKSERLLEKMFHGAEDIVPVVQNFHDMEKEMSKWIYFQNKESEDKFISEGKVNPLYAESLVEMLLENALGMNISGGFKSAYDSLAEKAENNPAADKHIRLYIKNMVPFMVDNLELYPRKGNMVFTPDPQLRIAPIAGYMKSLPGMKEIKIPEGEMEAKVAKAIESVGFGDISPAGARLLAIEEIRAKREKERARRNMPIVFDKPQKKKIEDIESEIQDDLSNVNVFGNGQFFIRLQVMTLSKKLSGMIGLMTEHHVYDRSSIEEVQETSPSEAGSMLLSSYSDTGISRIGKMAMLASRRPFNPEEAHYYIKLKLVSRGMSSDVSGDGAIMEPADSEGESGTRTADDMLSDMLKHLKFTFAENDENEEDHISNIFGTYKDAIVSSEELSQLRKFLHKHFAGVGSILNKYEGIKDSPAAKGVTMYDKEDEFNMREPASSDKTVPADRPGELSGEETEDVIPAADVVPGHRTRATPEQEAEEQGLTASIPETEGTEGTEGTEEEDLFDPDEDVDLEDLDLEDFDQPVSKPKPAKPASKPAKPAGKPAKKPTKKPAKKPAAKPAGKPKKQQS